MNNNSNKQRTEQTANSLTKVSSKPIFISTLLFTLALCLLSIGQKVIIGADPFAPRGFIVPGLFGAISGFTVGALLVRNQKEYLRRILKEREASQELAISEKRFRLLAENARDVIFLYSFELRRYQYLSPSVYNLTGHLPEEFYVNPRLFNSLVHEEDREAIESIGPKIDQGELNPVLEFRIRHRDGRTIWINQRHTVTLDSSGNPETLEGICTDVSSFREAAKEKFDLEKQLQQSQRVESLGRLAGGIAHDFNNLLTVIQGYVDLLISSPSLEEGQMELNQIKNASQKASDLTRQLLAFSRHQATHLEVKDPGQVVIGSVEMIKRIVGETIQLNCQIEDNLPVILLDSNQLDQIIVNLVLNAKDAVQSDGIIDIHVSKVEVTGQLCYKCGDPLEGDFLIISVADNGLGIAPENLERIFDPFFTTKDVGEGSGLGLSTVFGLVHQQNGHIQVSSQVNQGTTMKLLLPICTEVQTEGTSPLAQATSIMGQGESILIVEDEDLVRNLASTMLNQMGYEVLTATNGLEAMEILASPELSSEVGVDVVLTDVIMPEMGGVELARELRTRNPDQVIVLMTGYQDQTLDPSTINGGELPLLRKPFGAEELGRTIKQALTQSH